MGPLKINSLESFAYDYNSLREDGLIPKEIIEILMEKYQCRPTCYYKALKHAREKGLIVDTHKENARKANKRRRGEKRPYKPRPKVEKPVCACEIDKPKKVNKPKVKPVVEEKEPQEEVKVVEKPVNVKKVCLLMRILFKLIKIFKK